MADPKIRYDIAAHAEGGGEVDRLALSLEHLDNALDPAAAARAQALSAELRALGEQQGAIARFQELEAATTRARGELSAAEGALRAFRGELAASDTPTTAQAGRLEKLEAAVRGAKTEVLAQTAALDASRGRLAALGIDSESAARAEADLTVATKATRAELQALGTSLQGVSARGLVDELRQLGQQQQGIASLRDLDAAVDKARAGLVSAEGAVEAYRQKLAGIEAPTAAQVNQQQRLGFAVDDARAKLVAQTQVFDAAKAKLAALGVETGDLATAEDRLGAATQRVLTRIQSLGQQQQAVQRFVELGQATETARSRLSAADGAVEQFRAGIAGSVAPTLAETQELARLSDAARRAQGAFQDASQAQATSGAALRAAGVDTARLAQLQAPLRPQLTEIATAAQRVGSAYTAQGTAAVQSALAQVAATRQVGAGVDGLSDKLTSLTKIGVAGILGSQTFQLLKSVGETADAYSNLSARIRLVTGDGGAFKEALAGVFQVAERTNSGLESTATLFTRIAQAGKEIGLGQREALALTESINQAVQLSGGSAQAADAAIVQLVQGLQSGVLRGEEFNSVMEQAPRLAQALATGLGVTTGQLRILAQEGKLTAATVIQALQSQAGALDKEFKLLPATLGRAITNLGTEWTKFIGTLNGGQGTTKIVADGVNLLAGNLDKVAAVAERAGVVVVAALAIKGAAALRTFAVEATTAAGAANLLATNINKIPTAINVVIAVTGFEIGFQIGSMLHENSELARKLGVGITAFFENIVNDLQFVAEAAKAVFTDDTIEKAFERYRERGRALDETFKDLYEDAKRSPAEIRRAAEEAARATKELGDAGAGAGAQVSTAATAATGSVAGLGGAGMQAGSQIAAGATQGAHGVKGITDGATQAQEAILNVAKAAGLNLPAVGVSADQAAKALADAAAKSKAVASALGVEVPSAIAKLSGPGLDAFRSALVSALTASIGESKRLAEQFGDTSVAGSQALSEVARKSQLLQQVLLETGKQAAKSLGVDVVAASQNLSVEFQHAQDNLAVLIRSMPALSAAGVDAGALVSQALQKMFEGAKSTAELTALTDRVNALGKAGVLNAGQVSDFFDRAKEKAKELKAATEDATPGIQSLGEAARKAGVDVELLTTGVSTGFKRGLKDVTDLNEQIIKNGVSAEKAGPVLAAALDQRIAAAKTREELVLLDGAVQKIGVSGKLSGQQTVDALDKIRIKSEELSPALTSAQAAAKRLGIDLKDNLQKGSEAGVEGAIRAYESLKSGGKASAAELKAGFVSMAYEVIKANERATHDYELLQQSGTATAEELRIAAVNMSNSTVPEWLKIEAAIRKVTITTDESGNAIVQAAKKGEDGLKQMAGSFGPVKQGATEAQQAILLAKIAAGEYITETEATLLANTHLADSFNSLATAARNAQDFSILGKNTYDKHGFATDASGNRITAEQQVKVPDGGSFDKAAFDRAAQAAARSGQTPPDPNRYVRDAGGSYVRGAGGVAPKTGFGTITDPVALQFFNPDGTRKGAAPTSSTPTATTTPTTPPSATPSSTPPSTHTVNISLQGQPATTVRVASSADATNLTDFIRQLEEAARSSGVAIRT